MRSKPSALKAAFLVAVSVAFPSAPGEPEARETAVTGTVVFVCEHGNVKSLIAREWFNRLAAQRGLQQLALSRGVTPGRSVPPAIAEALRGEGFDVTGFEPSAFRQADLKGAVRIVGIGVDLTSVGWRSDTPLEAWDGIPPASERYAASRDALRSRIESLLEALASTERRR